MTLIVDVVGQRLPMGAAWKDVNLLAVILRAVVAWAGCVRLVRNTGRVADERMAIDRLGESFQECLAIRIREEDPLPIVSTTRDVIQRSFMLKSLPLMREREFRQVPALSKLQGTGFAGCRRSCSLEIRYVRLELL